MKKSIKLIAMVLACVMVLGLCACGGSQTATDTDGEVTLKWLTAGPGKQKDSDLVWATFNEKLAEKMPNTQVEIEALPFADFAEKWRLMIAANETIDIAWSGYAVNYTDEVKKGGYLELNDLLTQHAPKLYKSMPEWVWDLMDVDGKIYGIPCYQMMVSRPAGFKVFKEDAEKYMDYKALEEELLKKAEAGNPVLSEKAFDVIENYLLALNANGVPNKGFAPYNIAFIGEAEAQSDYGLSSPVNTVYLEYDETGRPIAKDGCAPDVTDVFYKRMAGIYQKGLIRKDVLTASDIRADEGVIGGYAMWYHAYDKFTEQQESLQIGKDIKVIHGEEKYIRPTGPAATNNSLPRSCSNPVRAMQFLEVLNDPADTSLYNMLVYGIEDKHYKKVGDNKIETLDYVGSPTLDSGYGIQKWVIGDSFNAYMTQGDVEGYDEYVKTDMNANAVAGNMEGFKFDKTPVKTELAQIDSVRKEFYGLRYGTYTDWQAKLKEYREKVQKCGQQKVIAEVQRQLDAWYDAQNK